MSGRYRTVKFIKYICPICHKKKMIYEVSKSCRKCYYKTLSGKGNPMYGRKGKLHPNWKGGVKNNNCLDCNKKIKKGYKRCHSCACKNIWNTSKKMNNRNFIGKNNPNYKGGLSNFPYPIEFNEQLKEKIRKRDNYTCQNCNMTEEEHIIVSGIKLIVHHIDYNKKNCKEDNLISLCNWCNVRANYNRDYWKDYYKEKVNGSFSSKS